MKFVRPKSSLDEVMPIKFLYQLHNLLSLKPKFETKITNWIVILFTVKRYFECTYLNHRRENNNLLT